MQKTTEKRHFCGSDELCRYMAEKSDSVVLAFSCGKDAIASWLQLKRYFSKIYPVYHFLVPGLGFVEKSLKYYEEFFQTKIVQTPNNALIQMLKSLVFQAPENCLTIEKMRLKTFERDHCSDVAKSILGLSIEIYTGIGVRVCDSMTRRTSIKRFGLLNPKKKTFYPVFDWNKARMVSEFQQAQVRLPIDYKLFGRTFDGINYHYLKPIKDHFPEDYKKILEFFPLAELEIKREEWKERHHGIL